MSDDKRGYRGLPPSEVDPDSASLYDALIETVFVGRYRNGATSVPFERDDLPAAAAALGRRVPKNVGDVVYAYRSRKRLPNAIVETQPEGMEWVIEGAGHGRYVFKLVPVTRPNPDLIAIKIPDATPEIVSAYALSDEQALLAKIRYNRLHLSRHRSLFASEPPAHDGPGRRPDRRDLRRRRQQGMPIHDSRAGEGWNRPPASRPNRTFGVAWRNFLVCRSISTQFMHDDLIAMSELAMEDDEVKIVSERHYRLVQADRTTPDDLKSYSIRS